MHKLPQPVKLWYLSSFYRAEAPQRGRYRQFWQVGAESGVAGGGRYDRLIELIGEPRAPRTPACGWAAGVERMLLASPEPPTAPEYVDLFVAMARGQSGDVERAFELTHNARRAGLQ